VPIFSDLCPDYTCLKRSLHIGNTAADGYDTRCRLMPDATLHIILITISSS
jgi:hypothetical protein